MGLSHPLILDEPESLGEEAFWLRNSAYRSMSGRNLCSGMLGMSS